MRFVFKGRFKAGQVLVGAVGLGALGGLVSGLPMQSLAQSTITPTYYTDVQPILDRHCVSCHVVSGIGPFPLTTAKEAVDKAQIIAAVVKSGYMPPWPPGQDSQPFLDSRQLGSATKQILLDWVKAGAPLGKPTAGQRP